MKTIMDYRYDLDSNCLRLTSGRIVEFTQLKGYINI